MMNSEQRSDFLYASSEILIAFVKFLEFPREDKRKILIVPNSQCDPD